MLKNVQAAIYSAIAVDGADYASRTMSVSPEPVAVKQRDIVV
jgi:hypothetical protein